MRISTLQVIFYFMNFFVAQTCITFFSINKKLNISDIYKSIILIFTVNLPLVIYQFYSKKFKSNNHENLENKIQLMNVNISTSSHFSVNLPIVFIYLYFVKKEYESNHQENFENKISELETFKLPDFFFFLSRFKS